MTDLFSPTPYVAGSDTSRDRALTEDSSGATTLRRGDLLERLRMAGPAGKTWRELATDTGLHHGQVSGALSVMHKDGLIASLTTRRDRCHPYIHAQYIGNHHPDTVMLEPAQTLAGKRNAAIQDVIDAARYFCERGLGAGNIREALKVLDALEDAQ